jgi:hypothetical protein
MEPMGYVVFGAIVAALVFGYWRLSVSLRRWKQPPSSRMPDQR